jgi:hypothetical protein
MLPMVARPSNLAEVSLIPPIQAANQKYSPQVQCTRIDSHSEVCPNLHDSPKGSNYAGKWTGSNAWLLT